MRNITYTLIFLLSTLLVNVQAKNIDTLEKKADINEEYRSQAQQYTSLAEGAIQFNSAKTREVTYGEADKAIAYVLKAIHFNSRLNDTLAIRNNFNCLASAYVIQHKYTQAKWFVLQSNYISRNRKDVPAMINSLMQLASIKITIKDYKLAEKDINEAIVLSKYKNDVTRQIEIEKCLATLYDNTSRSKMALATEKHCDYLAANIDKITAQQAKENEVRMIAQAKIAAEQAKITAVKMAIIAKANQAAQAKLAVVQAKTNKANERMFLTVLKKENQWPLALPVNTTLAQTEPVITHTEEAKTETENSVIASLMAQEK